MNFMDQLNRTLTDGPDNVSVTENGAVGYKTTGQKLLDINFAVSSLRKAPESEIRQRFADALAEDRNAAIAWLFFARDVRGGLGERRLFRICMQYLAQEFPDTVRKILPLIAEYGRWDDVIVLIDTQLRKEACLLLANQLVEDGMNMKSGNNISLLAKWMPSENASSPETKRKARELMTVMGMTPKAYRQMLSSLRKKIKLVEQMMSTGKWGSIKYETVPSRANMIYNSAFLRHDETRRREFLGKANKGEVKMNAATLFPHEIVHRYGRSPRASDPALEAMWKNLPNTVKNAESSTIVVADGSGSMFSRVDYSSGTTAIEVANAMALYFAEHLHGPYQNRYITFSANPQLVDLRGASSLRERLNIAYRHDEVANTNIEAVFDLILQTAVQNRLRQDDLPHNVLVISDMEFDNCVICNRTKSVSTSYWNRPTSLLHKTLFDEIAKKYAQHGYKLPRLIFWNVASRSGTIPVKKNDMGVALVSGFSPNVAKMVMSNKTDPYSALLETLHGERYQPVWEALMK